MAQHKFQIWINDSELIGHIETSDCREEEARQDGLELARDVWDERTSIHQVSVCEVGFQYYTDLAQSSAPMGAWA